MLLTSALRFFPIVVFFSLNLLPKIDAEAYYHDDGIGSSESNKSNEASGKSFDEKSESSSEEDSSHDPSSNWHFTYGNTDEWGQYYPACYGTRQSPIDLKPYSMTSLKVSSPLVWKGYRTTPRNMTIVNNGHSVELAGFWDNKDDVPRISGGTLVGNYVFHQLHFHWGPRNDTGSEHTIGNRSLPLEMHLVHYKKDYESAAEAIKHEDGLAVVGVFFEVGASRNKGILNLQKYSRAIKTQANAVKIRPFPLSKFNVNFSCEYVSYLGSLTTPPCSEIVTWILPATPRFLTESQIDLFRSIELAAGDNHNNRPTMPHNGRIIYHVSRY